MHHGSQRATTNVSVALGAGGGAKTTRASSERRRSLQRHATHRAGCAAAAKVGQTAHRAKLSAKARSQTALPWPTDQLFKHQFVQALNRNDSSTIYEVSVTGSAFCSASDYRTAAFR